MLKRKHEAIFWEKLDVTALYVGIAAMFSFSNVKYTYECARTFIGLLCATAISDFYVLCTLCNREYMECCLGCHTDDTTTAPVIWLQKHNL